MICAALGASGEQSIAVIFEISLHIRTRAIERTLLAKIGMEKSWDREGKTAKSAQWITLVHL